ncbi:hypothetical protein Tco_1392554, partial [Tanacetum coccineum]
YMSSPCHIELTLFEKEEPVKKEVDTQLSNSKGVESGASAQNIRKSYRKEAPRQVLTKGWKVQTSLALLAKDVVIAGILKKLTFNEERWFFKRSVKVSRSGKAPSQWKMIIPNRESVWNKYLYLGTYSKLKNHVLSEDWLITQATENYDVPTHVLSSSEIYTFPLGTSSRVGSEKVKQKLEKHNKIMEGARSFPVDIESGHKVAEVVDQVVLGKLGENVRAKAKNMSHDLKIKRDEEIDIVADELLHLCSSAQPRRIGGGLYKTRSESFVLEKSWAVKG